jgi:predicted Zn finger-like uncharacterized protein
VRLTCPQCDAQYEVEAEALAPGGRDVQCSNCEHIWFALAPPTEEDDAALAPPPGPAPASAPREIPAADDEGPAQAPEPPGPPSSASPAALQVLREERAAEDRFRAEEAADRAPDPVAPPPAPTRAERLPEIETVRPAPRPARPDPAPPPPPPAPRRRTGLRRAVLLALLVLALGAALYAYAQEAAEAVPDLAPAIDAYAAWVEERRAAAEAYLETLADRIAPVDAQAD